MTGRPLAAALDGWTRDRLAAFTDGVVAVIITIMVLELKAPRTADVGGLAGVVPAFLSYVLSFAYVAIYWNNHHHLFALVERVDGGILWANLHVLFWMSLMPFATSWVGEHHAAALPTTVYGLSLLMPALAWLVLQRSIIRSQGPDSALARALGRDVKGRSSAVLYAAGILLAFASPAVSDAIFAAVALMWLVPDRRLEVEIERDRAARPEDR